MHDARLVHAIHRKFPCIQNSMPWNAIRWTCTWKQCLLWLYGCYRIHDAGLVQRVLINLYHQIVLINLYSNQLVFWSTCAQLVCTAQHILDYVTLSRFVLYCIYLQWKLIILQYTFFVNKASYFVKIKNCYGLLVFFITEVYCSVLGECKQS